MTEGYVSLFQNVFSQWIGTRTEPLLYTYMQVHCMAAGTQEDPFTWSSVDHIKCLSSSFGPQLRLFVGSPQIATKDVTTLSPMKRYCCENSHIIYHASYISQHNTISHSMTPHGMTLLHIASYTSYRIVSSYIISYVARLTLM